jgi:hypothetical protein
MSDHNESKPAPALGPAMMRAIGCKLRAMYAHIIAEGVRNDLPPSCVGWMSRRPPQNSSGRGVRTLNLKPSDGDT